MKNAVSLGVDVGSISTKGVLTDSGGAILAGEYLWTEGDPVGAVKTLVGRLTGNIPAGSVIAAGVTGSARRLTGAMLEACAVKNEITAHAVGTLSRRPDVRTIMEIGGQDAKIIIIEDGVVVDYAMNTLCAAGTGAFLSSQAKRMGFSLDELGELALRSKNPARISARCTVFAESDMVHKAQVGVAKEDLVAGLCTAVVSSYLNNVGKGKRICAPIVFQGGVSKNRGVVEAFRTELAEEIHVDPDAHLMGAVGAAILAARSPNRRPPAPDAAYAGFRTEAVECRNCENRCEIIRFYKNGRMIDAWGNRCEAGLASAGADTPSLPDAQVGVVN